MQHRVPDAEPAERVGRLQRIVEELAVVVDAREARHRDELVAEDLVPELFDGRDLGEEAVAADVEAIALVLRGARDAADDVVGFEHGDAHSRLGEQIGRRQAGRAGADDHDVIVRLKAARSSGRRRRCIGTRIGH